MTIKEVLAELDSANHPVARALHKGESFKTLIIGFKKGMKLKEHQAALPTRIAVLSGKLRYAEEGVSVVLLLHDDHEIPVHRFHSVEALEDSVMLLTQGK